MGSEKTTDSVAGVTLERYSMGMSGFTKLFSSIIHSTIWREPNHVRLVWVTMLAMADRRGVVEAAAPGLADAARVSVAECREALDVLMAPDPDSRSQEHEGRRVEYSPADGGWAILNYAKYRKKMSEADQRERTRARVANHRANKSKGVTPPVTESNAGNDIAEAEAEAEAEENKGRVAPGASPAEVKQVWDHFVDCRSDITTSAPPKLNDTRRRHIKARLRSYGAERVLKAVTAMLDPQSWHVQNGRIQPELVFRSDEQLEKHEGGTMQQLPTPETRTPEVRLPPPRGSE